MKKMIESFLLAFFFIVSFEAVAAERDSVRVLFIGNSFTYYNDMPQMVRKLAESQGLKYACTAITKGGQRFKGQLEDKRVVDALSRGGWDYLVLQEQSNAPALSTRSVIDDVYPYAHALDSLAHAASKDVKVIYYMTWGHKYGSRRNIAGYRLDDTYECMQWRLATSYLEMAYENNGWCAPVGLAWLKVRAERPTLRLYAPDSYHPSEAGSYLAANVIFATMLGKAYQSSYDASLTAEEAEYLQQTAQQTVLDNLELCNITPIP